MIERAPLCLHRGSRTAATHSSKIRNTQRYLHSAFWAHGAGDIELPPWWNSFLRHANVGEISHRNPTRYAPCELRSSFLDFLYPPKTIRFVQKVAGFRRRNNAIQCSRFATSGRKLAPRGVAMEDDSKRTDLSSVSKKTEWWTHRQQKRARSKLAQSIERTVISENDSASGALQAQKEKRKNVSSNADVKAVQPSASQIVTPSKSALGEEDSSEVRAGEDGSSTTTEGTVTEVTDPSIPAESLTDVHSSGSGLLDQAFVQRAMDQGMIDMDYLESTPHDDRQRLIDFWRRQSDELGEAFVAYTSSLEIVDKMPQAADDFESTFDYEYPVLKFHLESTIEAGVRFLDLLLRHLPTEVYPRERSLWSERQWAFFIKMVFLHPKRQSTLRLDGDDERSETLTGKRGIFRLLLEASKQGRALTSARDLLGLAIARRDVEFANSLLIFWQSQGLSVDSVLLNLDGMNTPLLVRWIVGIIERVEIPRSLRLRKDLYPRLQPNRKSYFDLVYLMFEHLLKRQATLDMNVALYEKAWATFLNYQHLSSSHFVLALDQLNAVESDQSSDLTAYVDLSYKLFNAASQRPDFVWSKEKLQRLLQRMTSTHHQQCWQVFKYHNKAFGFHSETYKFMLQELSNAGEAEHWQETFVELQSKENVEKFEYIHQLLIAYSKRADVATCRAILDSIETELGRSPNLASWNAVLHAYVQADNMSGALEFYDYMRSRGVQQDVSTSMSLLRGYATRGEYVQASGQLAKIRAEGYELTSKMVYHLVFACLSNEDMNSAEQLLFDTIDLPDQDSRIDSWNAVLTTYAHQGKIADMNYLHKLMLQHGIQDNEKTYAALMLGFSNGGDASLAFKIVSEVMPMHNVVPTIHHYNILMSVLVRTHQYENALRVYQTLNKKHLKPDASTQNLAIRAMASFHGHIQKGQRGFDRVRNRALEQAEEFFRQTMESGTLQHVVSKSSMIGREGQPMDQAFASLQFSPLLMREGRNWSEQQREDYIKKYQEFYNQKYPHQKVEPPVRMLASIAEHYAATNNLGGIDKVWRQALESMSSFAMRTDADPEQPNHILRSRSTLLGPIFRLYMIALMKRDQDIILGQTITNLTRAGWRFSSSMWNTYVQFLAQRGEIHLAFQYCEQHLMDGFTGWPRSMKAGLSPKKELDKKSPGTLRWQIRKPDYKTLVWLAYAYMVWRRRNAFNVHRGDLLVELWEIAPRTLNVVSYMPRVDDVTQTLVLKHPTYGKVRKVVKRDVDEDNGADGLVVDEGLTGQDGLLQPDETLP